MKTKYKSALILLLILAIILSLTVLIFISGCGGRGIDIVSGDDNDDNDIAQPTSSAEAGTDDETETTEFSVNSSDINEKELMSMTTSDREAFVAALDEKYRERFKSLKVSKSYKSVKNHNPLITQRLAPTHSPWFMMAGLMFTQQTMSTNTKMVKLNQIHTVKSILSTVYRQPIL